MKLYRTLFLILALSIIVRDAQAQRGKTWCFGDSALIDFNSGVPVPGVSSLDTRGSCISISDTNGDLLFYGNTRATLAGNTGLIFNRNHLLMTNGDSILGQGWYHELVILPTPNEDSLYYVFSIGVTISSSPGLFFSIIDMKGDNGVGEVIQKNIPLLGNIRMVDCLTAIKHGNGRDWWVIARPSPVQQPTYNNIWNVFLISTNGITLSSVQNVGELNGTNLGNIAVSPDGSKICFANLGGLIENYDFDRCSGLISNPVLIEPQLTIGPYPYYWSTEFSQSGRYLYVTSSTVNGILWQYDTWATNIAATKTLIWQMTFPPATIGSVKRGPDNKIYLSCAWSDSTNSNNYPYPPTAYYTENMNLSVINSPDSAGTACDFQPWSFYLGGKRTYWGLPNNPDYDLPALAGSPCDSLVSQNELAEAAAVGSLHVYYHPAWEKAFINASNLKGKSGKLLVYDMHGKVVHSEPLRIQNGYYTRDLSMVGYAKGMYLITIQTEKEQLTKKMMVE